MKQIIISSILFTSLVMAGGCSKPKELVPPNNSVMRDYVLPPASFMTPAERNIINERREEYNSIL